MADEANAPAATAGSQRSSPANGNHDSSQTITLKIIQPSVPIPTILRDLPTETTVKQLKQRLREHVVIGESEEPRMIYRGRVMAPDDANLLTVLGEAAIRESSELAIHLVIQPPRGAPAPMGYQRQGPNSRPSSRPSSQPPPMNRNPVPDPATAAARQAQMAQAQAHMRAHAHTHAHTHTHTHTTAHTLAHAQALAQAQAQRQQLVNMQREAMLRHQEYVAHQQAAAFRHQVNQNQRDRTSAGLHGIQDDMRSATPGRSSPVPGQTQRTYVRETIGPDGQHLRFTVTQNTVVTEAPTSDGPPNAGGLGPHGGLSPFDVQNAFRTADTHQAMQAWNAALNRNAPGPSSGTPMNGLSRAGSRTATPEPGRVNILANLPRAQSEGAGPEVYILMSPAGPRALLMHSTHGTYITPQARPSTVQLPLTPLPPGQMPLPQIPLPQVPNPARMPLPTPPIVRLPTAPPAGDGQDAVVQQWLQRPQQQPAAAPGAAPAAQEALVAGQQNPAQPAGAQPQVRPLHRGNPNAGLMAAMGQHIWLLIRIGLLIWWFTGPDTTWTRWAMFIALGIAVLIISSGLLDAPAQQVWQPIRRHIEGLLPRDPPANRPAQPAAAAGAAPENAGAAPNVAPMPLDRNGEPDPREIARRLVHDRQVRNGTWVMQQIRRMERAGILFLASIVPGLAEGHVQRAEAEAREERRRVEAEEAAAVAAREAETAVAAEGDAAEGEGDGAGSDGDYTDMPSLETVPEATSSGVDTGEGARHRDVGGETQET